MKKPGGWIAAFGSTLDVSRLTVEAAPALGVVRVTVSSPDLSRVLAVYHLDRVEALALDRVLDNALRRLELSGAADHS